MGVILNSTVTVSTGMLRGTQSNGVHAFRGIPYAAPPVGANRWQPPQPAVSWDGIRDASIDGLIAPQPLMPPPFAGGDLPPAGDDCLNLSVWTPDPAASGLPVLVWIHGGAFVSGSSIEPTYDGASFARQGVVCVTINYRLGALGFLHLGEHFPELADSGNLGILDQVAALQWVQQNIAAFGGDPGRVTVAGESAGGMSVGTLLALESTNGLFQRAILQSGAGHNGISAPTASAIAGHLLELVGVAPGDIDALRQLTSEQLLEAQNTLTLELQMTRNPIKFGEAAASAMAFQPTFGTAVLPLRPIEAITAGSAANVAVLTGTTMEECLVFVVAMKDMFSDELVEMTMAAVFGSQAAGTAALDRYRSNRANAAPHEIVAAAQTDSMFRVPAVRMADAQSAHNPNVWMYRFDWQTPVLNGSFGACHALELAYVFNNLDSELAAMFAGPNAPRPLADAMHTAWANFITHGDPAHDGLPAWPRYTTSDRSTLLFNEACSVATNPRADELALWDGII